MSEHIRAWIEGIGYSNQHVPDEAANFHWLVTVNPGLPAPVKVDVYNLRAHPNIIMLMARSDISERWNAIKPKMDQREQARFILALHEKLLAAGLNYANATPEFGDIHINEYAPSDASLTSTEFFRKLATVERGTRIVLTHFNGRLIDLFGSAPHQ